MQRSSDTQRLAAQIRNAAWLVRHYAAQRTPAQRIRRAQAIKRLGLAVRDSFQRSDDFEPLLIAIVEGLVPKQYEPPF